MNLRRLAALFLAVVFSLCFSACSGVESEEDNLLSAPRLEGDLAPIQQALEEYAGEGITLKYPVSGEYRSALILKDVTGDGRNEAVAFYSTTVDKTVTMHINVIASDGKKWASMGDLSLVGSGVESVSFSDLDGNGTEDIIVGWNIYGNVDKQVGVYTFDKGKPVQRVLEPYSAFLCHDITDDGISDLSVIYLNSAEKTALAKVIALTDIGISEMGQVTLDGGVTSYSTPVVSTLKDGTPALYIDAVKGVGMQTEIIWFEEGVLKTLFDPEAPETSLTYRASAVASRDYNGDGVIDLPLTEILLSTANLAEADKVWFTNWSTFDGKAFRLIASTFMNYSDGYSLTVPEHLKTKLHLVRRTQDRLRIFYAYDPEVGAAYDEIFRYIAATPAEYSSGKLQNEGYFLLKETDALVYLAAVSEENELGITKQDVKNMFSIIK